MLLYVLLLKEPDKRSKAELDGLH